MTSKKDYEYYICCINANKFSIHDMLDNASMTTYEVVRKHTTLKELALELGYAANKRKDLTLKDDWSIDYCKSTFEGMRCYFVRQSHIEYIFVNTQDLEKTRGNYENQ